MTATSPPRPPGSDRPGGPDQPGMSGQPVLPTGQVRPHEKRGADYEHMWVRQGRGTFPALLVLLFVALLAVFGAWKAFTWARDKVDPPGDPGAAVVLSLAPGSTTSGIADTLQENEIIADSGVYQWYVRLKGGTGFQAGDYTFFENSAAWEVMDVLRAGPDRVAQAEQIVVTIPEGLTVIEVAAEIDATAGIEFTGAEFLAVLRSGAHTSIYAPDPGAFPEGVIEPSEGLLFPDTYFLATDATASDLLEQMVARFDFVLRELGYTDSTETVGLTPYETVVLASLIEREARVPGDRAKISRVIHNRLLAGWTLGIDATIVYFTGDNVLTVTDLETESPYNSRLNTGLPPTPIAVSGRAALEAAINPVAGQWMFYVLASEDGRHAFSVSSDEFERDKQTCADLGLGCG
ncbi:MAG: UPF0755 protein [Candidatus Poriferisodalaceae bacterium]